MARYYHEYSDTLVENAVAEVRITIDDAEVLKLYLNGPAPDVNNTATRYNAFSSSLFSVNTLGNIEKILLMNYLPG